MTQTTTDSAHRTMATPFGWLGLGAAATVLAANRWGIPALLWIAAVPFLVAAARARGWRVWLLIGGVLLVTQTVATAKIITAPLPLAMAPVFGVPMAIGALLQLGLWRLARDRAGRSAALYAWPAMTALSDWFGYTHTELSAWTTSANGLATDPMWVQLTAVGGMALLGALVALVNVTIAEWILAPARLAPHGVVTGSLLAAGALHGVLRLDRLVELPGPTVRAAAIVTDVGLTEAGLPDDATLATNTDHLFALSADAVARGAELVVWNEAAAFVRDDADLLRRAAGFAAEHHVELVVAYGVPVSTEPLRFRNEYMWFGPDGAELLRYAKHHPVPGEPSVRGEGPLTALDRPYGRAGGVICYDWDFPATARAFAAAGAGFVFVPSSDWRGVDPLHTQMAGVRAVESGLSVLRPVRAAASAGFDAAGRVRGWKDAGAGVLVVDLPTTPVPTLYARWGDTPMLTLSGLVLAGVLALGLRRRVSAS